ncbi:MAG: protease inhibitor I42 family protein [Candidatus Obscuribacterales bacterium]|nr:protease inhibitor I42 family protein [Candidatus Obscuribacterales bacterium]
MALCQTCQGKSTLNVPGKCTSCGSLTTHFAYRLCDACSAKQDECEWCQTPLSAGASSPLAVTQAGVSFVTCRDVDDGRTFKNMRVGEEIHVILPEDQYAWKEWATKSLPYGLREKVRGAFTPDQHNPQYGTRTIIYEVRANGNYLLELHEVQRSWSWGWSGSQPTLQPIPGGKVWKATFDVK